ncbi:MAG: OmpA family protein, partial [Bryobacterales bacterium]|nr:OmpA family protein [Bryobacterales bacterium]
MKLISLLIAGVLMLAGQGLTTDASPKDWEEVNFEFDSAILSDGYPSLLRLAELLKQNPSYRLELTGHTDSKGSAQYNEGLSIRRSNTVKEFLVKYGANPNQVSTKGEGKSAPKVSNSSKEGRFMNRRVVMTLRDGNGNIVAAGGVGDSINALQELLKKQEECCNEILKRLDKLDDILNALNGLKNENDKLRNELGQLKNAQDALANQVASSAAAAPSAQASPSAPLTPASSLREADRASYPGYDTNKFTLMGINVGPRTPDGNITLNARARYFNPFNRHFALQSEGEYFYWKDRQEGQFDLGLVGRGGPLQLGLFSSFKHVNFADYSSGATLGQASGTVDYVFNRGRVGIFGTKALLTDRLLDSVYINNVLRRDTYLSVVDQFGFSGQVGLWGDAYLEGNLGTLFRRYGDNTVGGMGRIVQPVNRLFAFTVEGGVNETLVATSGRSGRFAV